MKSSLLRRSSGLVRFILLKLSSSFRIFLRLLIAIPPFRAYMIQTKSCNFVKKSRADLHDARLILSLMSVMDRRLRRNSI